MRSTRDTLDLIRPDFASTAPAVAWWARHMPQSTAVVESGVSVTYQAMAAHLAQYTRALEQTGVGPGMLIGIEARHDRYLLLLMMLSCEVMGAAIVVLNPAALHPGDPLVPHCDLLLLASSAPSATGRPSRVISNNFVTLAEPGPPTDADLRLLERAVDPAATARILLTSGTTGRPKAVPISMRTQRARIATHLEPIPAEILQAVTFLCIYSFGISHVHLRALAVLQRGGSVLLMKDEQAAAILGSGLANHAVLMVGDAERIALAAPPSPYLENTWITLAGARAGAVLRRLVRERLGYHVYSTYASNETFRITAIGDDDVGTLVPGASARIVDESGRALALGQIGLIQVRTGTMADHYFNDPAATRAAFIDGWYHTNDAGTMPEPGKLVVLGRADTMLNVGGIKIAPGPIEDRLRQIDGVTDAVLTTILTAAGNSTLLAAVELSDTAMTQNLEATLGSILAGYTRQYELLPLRWFPRTESGKVRRLEIEAMFQRRRGERMIL